MAFKIHGEVSLDGAMFKRGLHEISGETTAFIKNFALGAIGVASIEQAFDKTIESAEELVNTSKNLSIGIEQLQVLRQAAKESGIEFSMLEHVMANYNSQREKALQGNGKLLSAFAGLGIGKTELQNQTSAQSIMGQISEKARGSNAADIAKEMSEVFGKGWKDIFGLLKTDFEELGTKMKDMGAIMDSTTAIQLKQFKDEMDLIGSVVTATLAPALVTLGGVVYDVITGLGSLGTFLGNWMASLSAHPLDVLFGNAGKQATDDAVAATKEFASARSEAWRAMVDRAKENIPVPPATIDDETKAKKLKSERSDSLISVGNFLGAGRGAIDNIASQQLRIANQHLQVARDTKLVIETKTDALQKSTDSLIRAFGKIPDWGT